MGNKHRKRKTYCRKFKGNRLKKSRLEGRNVDNIEPEEQAKRYLLVIVMTSISFSTLNF